MICFGQTSMYSVIHFSTLINHVTNENRFYERYETFCDMPLKIRYESFHIFELKKILITKATFNNRKLMNNLAFVVPIHVCLQRDT